VVVNPSQPLNGYPVKGWRYSAFILCSSPPRQEGLSASFNTLHYASALVCADFLHLMIQSK
jgi:hypothetical protein